MSHDLPMVNITPEQQRLLAQYHALLREEEVICIFPSHYYDEFGVDITEIDRDARLRVIKTAIDYIENTLPAHFYSNV